MNRARCVDPPLIGPADVCRSSFPGPHPGEEQRRRGTVGAVAGRDFSWDIEWFRRETEKVLDDGSCDEFIMRLAACQNRLYAYVLSLLPDPEQARDIVQESNLVMWRKASEFKPGTNFESWACKIAYFEVLAACRKKRQDRLLFSDELMHQLARDAERKLSEFSDKEVALEECLERLDPQNRGHLMARYGLGGSVKGVAEQAGITPGAAAVILYRIRKTLLECIQGKLATGQTT